MSTAGTKEPGIAMIPGSYLRSQAVALDCPGARHDAREHAASLTADVAKRRGCAQTIRRICQTQSACRRLKCEEDQESHGRVGGSCANKNLIVQSHPWR